MAKVSGLRRICRNAIETYSQKCGFRSVYFGVQTWILESVYAKKTDLAWQFEQG